MARRGPADPTPADLADHLQREAPRPVYGLFGEEEFARGQALAALRSAVLGQAPPDLALSQYDSSDAPDPPALFDELRTPSFLAPRRLIVLDDANDWVRRAGDALLAYLARPSATGVLVLILKSLPRNTKLGKAVRKAGMAIACEPPRERELPGWILARARAHGKRMDSPAARRLADCVGVNLPLLDQNLAKLALYVGDRPAITEADVEALVEDLPVTTIFRLTDALGHRDPGKALRVLDTLLEQNHDPSYILSMVRWAMERLLTARTLLDAGASPAQIGKALRMRTSYFLDQLLRQAQGRTRPELLAGFARLVQADLDVKTSAKDPRHALEHLLLHLAR